MARRDYQLDAIRGFAIILVVIGHIIFSWRDEGYPLNILLGEAIYTFHMPLFFLISGFLVYNHFDQNFFRWTWKKFSGLVIPYVIFTITACYFLHGIHLDYVTLPVSIANLVSYVEPSSAWFLPVLFEVLVLLAVCIHLETRCRKYGRLVFPASFVLCLAILPLSPLFQIKLLNQIITFFPYLAAGYYVNNFKAALSGAGNMFDRTLPIMFGVLLFPALYALKYLPDFYGFISISPVFSLLYRGMLVAAGTLLAVLFIKQISGKYTYPVKMLFVLCGILSLEIYLTHLIVLHYLGFYQVTLWPDTGLVGAGIGTLAVLLAAIAASLALSYNKWISLFFFGRWVQKTIKDLARSRISPDSMPADQP